MSSPRRRLMTFFLIVGTLLSVVPFMNVMSRTTWASSSQGLYSVDVLFAFFGGALRRIGISTAPSEVVIGRSGWLFLGDNYEQGVSVKRLPATIGDMAIAQRFADQSTAWDRWYRGHGVASSRVLVCADKDSIYADLLPEWDRPVAGTAIDLAIQRSDARIVVDSRPALRAARLSNGLPLYLRADTHWTKAGAWIAYRSLAQAWSQDEPKLKWLHASDVTLAAGRQAAGDLAQLLRAGDDESDESVVETVSPGLEAGRTAEDALARASVTFLTAARLKPYNMVILVRSPHALNARRLLWLRDSFGGAMLPYMAATFTEIVEVHRDVTNAQRVATLVARFKPDLVLDSMAERNARNGQLQMPPGMPEIHPIDRAHQ